MDAFDEGSHFTWVTHLPGVAATARDDIDETANGSHLDVSLEWTGPLAGVVATVYGRRTRQSLTQEANGHKAASEAAEGASTGCLHPSGTGTLAGIPCPSNRAGSRRCSSAGRASAL